MLKVTGDSSLCFEEKMGGQKEIEWRTGYWENRLDSKPSARGEWNY